MGLSAQDRQALDIIEGSLADSDPRLASMLATFSRLTAEEEMPAREKIRPVRCRLLRSRRVHDPRRWRYKALALWVVITMALIGAALAASHIGSSVCRGRAPACAGRAPATHLKSGRIFATAVTRRSGLESKPPSAAGPPASVVPPALARTGGQLL